ncbi:MAG: hypothetical protein JSS35_13265 [Proteobacteria bacterium]|nr:hypothetical protein [Pseudomonadota bacterium]
MDCDGVLADFDKGAQAILRAPPETYERVHGSEAFWKKLARADSFFERLDLMPDAMELYEAVRSRDPIILTGMPHGQWAEPQKLAWAARHFPGVPIITTMAALKREHCEPGDVLVDDRAWHAKRWEEAGGLFVHHTSARASIAALRAAGYI